MPRGVYSREFMPPPRPRDIRQCWISDAEKARLRARLAGDLSEATLPAAAQRRIKWERDVQRCADIRFAILTHLAAAGQATVAEMEALSPSADNTTREVRRVRRVILQLMADGEVRRVTGKEGRILYGHHVFAIGECRVEPRRIGRPPKA